ncbi:hypothetical protein EMIHUDRAFT_433357, partial [Emiliania huxleyi CCMP1516]
GGGAFRAPLVARASPGGGRPTDRRRAPPHRRRGWRPLRACPPVRRVSPPRSEPPRRARRHRVARQRGRGHSARAGHLLVPARRAALASRRRDILLHPVLQCGGAGPHPTRRPPRAHRLHRDRVRALPARPGRAAAPHAASAAAQGARPREDGGRRSGRGWRHGLSVLSIVLSIGIPCVHIRSLSC